MYDSSRFFNLLNYLVSKLFMSRASDLYLEATTVYNLKKKKVPITSLSIKRGSSSANNDKNSSWVMMTANVGTMKPAASIRSSSLFH